MYPTEIKYFSKVDETGEHGQAGQQKGAIGIFKDTKVRVDGLTLVVSNPDRDWVLRADEMAVGNATVRSPRANLQFRCKAECNIYFLLHRRPPFFSFPSFFLVHLLLLPLPTPEKQPKKKPHLLCLPRAFEPG